jgi:hypothetical protein
MTCKETIINEMFIFCLRQNSVEKLLKFTKWTLLLLSSCISFSGATSYDLSMLATTINEDINYQPSK